MELPQHGQTLWREQGIGAAHWHANGLKPHLVTTFKLSNDPHFIENLEDVVALYMNPPAHALVLCIDEKSQIQALDRTQPGSPVKKGRAGTTTLFAALDVLKGEVIGQCMPRHRHQEFLKFGSSLFGVGSGPSRGQLEVELAGEEVDYRLEVAR